MADDEVIKVCRNPNCTGKNPVKGEWCTARACKDMRAMTRPAKKQSKLAKAWPSIPGDRVELMVFAARLGAVGAAARRLHGPLLGARTATPRGAEASHTSRGRTERGMSNEPRRA